VIKLILKILLVLCIFIETFSTFAAEAPPFRARWPMINQEIEIGTRGFKTFDDEKSMDGATKERYGFGMGVTDSFFLKLKVNMKERLKKRENLQLMKLIRDMN